LIQVSEAREELPTDKLKDLSSGWLLFAAVGTFALYAMGFLSLRFHLAALGVRADLAVLDERYLFEGASCLVYLLAALAGLLLLLLSALFAVFLLTRLIPRRLRGRLRVAFQTRVEKIGSRVPPAQFALWGIAWSVLVIQLVMRQCFVAQNLLLSNELPSPAWLSGLLLADSDLERSFFFMGLLVAFGGTVVFWLAVLRRKGLETAGSRLALGLLTLLLGLEAGLLPINYGVITTGRPMPRVVHLGDDKALAGRPAWLVWEDREQLTLLVREPAAPAGKTPGRRTLLTVARESADPIEIAGSDNLLRRLFLEKP
jgi:hypothetical protein